MAARWRLESATAPPSLLMKIIYFEKSQLQPIQIAAGLICMVIIEIPRNALGWVNVSALPSQVDAFARDVHYCA